MKKGRKEKSEEIRLSMKMFFNIFINPSKVYVPKTVLTPHIFTWICAYLYGVVETVEGVGRRQVKEILGRTTSSTFDSMLFDNWIFFWVFVLLFGALNGILSWLIGGWWYHLRLRMSGYNTVEINDARNVYIQTTIVYSIPALILAIKDTFIYQSFRVSSEISDYPYVAVLYIFLCWSCFSSYFAIRRKFSATNIRAQLLFLYLPLVFNIGGFALLTYYYQKI